MFEALKRLLGIGKGDEMYGNVGTIDEAVGRLNVQGLSWLADAPLFIDKEQVEAFYDATVRPASKSGAVETTRSVAKTLEGTGEVGAEGTLGFGPGALLKLFPFLTAEAKLSGSASGTAGRTDESTYHAEYLPIDTPQRQLVRLAFHYFTNWRERTALVTEATFPGTGWWEPTFVRATPRALVFLDFPPQTLFIPSAAEVANGQVVLIFEKLVETYANDDDDRPGEYPGSEAPVSPEDAAKHEAYWGWFADHMRLRPNLASRAVEETIKAGGGRVQWIDYRVPYAGAIRPMHLHISARGAYDTGTFAYNFVQRGYRHGVRIVGTVKSEPDINVLAIFEK
jgi:hypothetical protein